MKELIRIRKTGDQKLVSARELHAFLVGSTNNTSKWLKANVSNNKFAIEGVDYQKVHTMEGNHKLDDFAITLDFAKRLSMMTKTAKGEEIRNYFIECEKQVVQPKSRLELARENVALIEELEAKDQLLLEQAPKVKFFDAVADSKDAIDIGEAAKVLNIGIGRNRLFELLRNKKILMEKNQPYQKYIDSGWFRVVEQSYQKPDGSTHISIKTLVYNKGLQEILKLAM